MVMLGLVANEWVLARLFSPDGQLGMPSRVAIAVFDVVMVAWGLALTRSRLARRLLLAAVPSLLLYVAVDTVVIATGLLVPSDAADRRRLFHEFYGPSDRLGFQVRGNLREFRLTWLRESVSAVYSTDEHGFRNVGRDYARAPVYVVGDSFAWGAWVDRDATFYGLLERALGQPVVSLGVGGYGPRQYEMLVKDFVGRHRPAVTALCLFANDLGRVPTIVESRTWYDKARARYRAPSAYQRSLTSRIILALGEGRVPQAEAAVATGRASNGLTLYARRGASAEYLTGGEYVEVEASVRRIIDHAAGAGSRLVVFLLPSKESAHKADYLRLFPADAGYLENEERGFERLCRLASAHGVSCLDLTVAFRAEAPRRQLYFGLDPHWNEDGHRLAVERMLPLIRAGLDKGAA
jgi:hypothetical protein